MKLSLSTGLAAGLLALAAAPALAAPVTVDLRIEGATRTLFEGPVTTDVRPFASNDGRARVRRSAPAVTRGAVIAAAAEVEPFAMRGTGTDSSAARASRRSRARTSTTTPPPGASWPSTRTARSLGGCVRRPRRRPATRCCSPTPTAATRLLALSGPATAEAGRDGDAEGHRRRDRRGGRGRDRRRQSVSAADGTVAPAREPTAATTTSRRPRTGAIRSNRVRVCVTDGADGACGTVLVPTRRATTPSAAPDRTPRRRRSWPASPTIRCFTRGPRELRGSFAPTPPAIKAVKLRLTKRVGKQLLVLLGPQRALPRHPLRPRRVLHDRRSGRLVLPAAGAARARAATCSTRGDRRRRQPHAARAREHAGGVHRPMKRVAVIAACRAARRRLRLRRRRGVRRRRSA